MDKDLKPKSRLRFYILFGAVAGALWAQVPIVIDGENPFSASLFEIIFILFAGALTGIAVTCALAPLLKHKTLWLCITLGIFALPLGAFLYGVFFTFTEMLVEVYNGTFHLRSSGGGYYYGAIERGLIFIYGSCATPFAALFFPMAIATTLLLWRMTPQPPATHQAPASA